jgi:hypothetical protein
MGREGIGGGMMKWTATQNLDLQPVRSGAPAVQPHCAAFHQSQALIAVAVGRNIVGEVFAFSEPYVHSQFWNFSISARELCARVAF